VTDIPHGQPKFWVDIPHEDCINNPGGSWHNVGCFASRELAVAFIREHFTPTCDDDGNVSLIASSHSRARTIPTLTLQSALSEPRSERGGILLVHNEEHWLNAWLRLSPSEWLEISFRDCNYPALHVAITQVANDADLAMHIRRNFADDLWHVNKCCLDGVTDSVNQIMPLEESCN